MEIIDNLKSAMQSGKESAILNVLMKTFGSQINAIKPTNEISTFTEQAMTNLFKSADKDGEFDAMSSMVAKLLVAEANDNPDHTLNKLIGFYEEFRVWYKVYSAKETHNEVSKL